MNNPQIACAECNGSGSCSDCNGQSVADHNDPRFCDGCDGSRRCLHCSGSGLIVNQAWLETVARQHWAMGHPVSFAMTDDDRLDCVICRQCGVTLWEARSDG